MTHKARHHLNYKHKSELYNTVVVSSFCSTFISLPGSCFLGAALLANIPMMPLGCGLAAGFEVVWLPGPSKLGALIWLGSGGGNCRLSPAGRVSPGAKGTASAHLMALYLQNATERDRSD